MGATLAALQRLQEIETQLSELRARIESRRRQVDQQAKRIAQIDGDIAREQLQVRTRQMDVDQLELEARSREAEQARFRTALNSAKTNKEYAAALMQLNTSKVDQAKIEERELEVMGALDDARKRLAGIMEKRAAEEQKLAELRAAAVAAEEQVRPRLEDLTRRRQSAAAEVPAEMLLLFERVAAKHEGRALAMVTRTHPKREEFCCEGCNMSVTLQQVNALMSQDKPVLCNTCGHILYLDPHAGVR